ncbi:Zinc knuckle CX2CX4HX4C, partial [Trema orientale]
MTLKREFGRFARILIDIDLSRPVSDSLMVEVGDDYFFIPLEYERLPLFCTSCKIIGHEASSYRHGHRSGVIKDADFNTVQKNVEVKKDEKLARGCSPPTRVTPEFLEDELGPKNVEIIIEVPQPHIGHLDALPEIPVPSTIDSKEFSF